MYQLSNYERETIINYNEGEDTASVYTHNKALRRRLEQLAQERPDDCKLFKVSHWDQAVEYYIPKSWVKINPTRMLSDAQRAALEKARLALKTPAPAENQSGQASGVGSDTSGAAEGEKTADSPNIFEEET